jgi:hypothetical protein
MVPRAHTQAVALNQSNGNSNRKDSEAIEKIQLAEYKTFFDKGNDSTIRKSDAI